MARARALLEKDEHEVIRCVSSGESVRLVALKFGVSDSTILRILQQHGVSPPKSRKEWTKRDQDMLESLYRLGLSPRDIALRMDRPLPTIRGKLRNVRRNTKADLVQGRTYILRQRATKSVDGMKDNEIRCVYLGRQRGAGVVHHVFRSVNAGYKVCVSNRQIVDYEILEG